MEFTSSRADIVRSANQRWLLAYWNDRRGAASLPVWRGLEQEFARASDDLSLNEVVADGATVRFRIKLHGARIAELYGSTSCVGKFLDEILPAAYREPALTTYRQTVSSRLPVYTIADMRDAAGRIIHYERLLLPFGRNDADVERILASLEIISPEGAFDHRGLMKAPEKAPAFAFLTTIQH
jgi:hypothetical protein